MNELDPTFPRQSAMPWGWETIPGEFTSDDFGTPPRLCALVALALGGIDLDPFANRWSIVPSARCYRLDRGQDARVLRWVLEPGRRTTVYANGPYSDPGWWVERCADLHEAGLVTSIACVPVDITAAWWREQIWDRATAIAWMRYRVRFLEEGRPAKHTARFSTAFPFYGPPGPELDRFFRVFESPHTAKVTLL